MQQNARSCENQPPTSDTLLVMAEGNLLRLSDEHLLTSLEAWDIAPVSAITPLGGGYSADVWRLDFENGPPLVAKFAYVTQDAHETQLRTAEFLNDRDLPVPSPIRTKTGELVTMVEFPTGKRHPLGLMTFIPGDRVEQYDDHLQRQAGNVLASIHAAMLEADFPSRSPRWFYSYLEDESFAVAQEERVLALARKALKAVRDYESSNTVTRGFIVADDVEFLYDDRSGALGIVDLGHSIWGPLVADVAITRLEIEGSGVSAQAFVDSYFAHAELPEAERAAVPVYGCMRLAGLARFFAWRVLQSSRYEQVERDANERRLEAFLEATESALAELAH